MKKPDAITIYFIFLGIGVLMAIYYFLDATYWNPEDYGPGTAEDQVYELQNPEEFYAP